MDRITTLTHNSLLLTKKWAADGTIAAYDNPKYLVQRVREVYDLSQLSALLTQLEAEPKTCVIRGGYVGDAMALSRDPEAVKGATVRRTLDCFSDQPLHSVLVDVDGYDCMTADPFT